MTAKTCANCQAAVENDANTMICKRHVPQLVNNRGQSNSFAFPICAKTDWCYEHVTVPVGTLL